MYRQEDDKVLFEAGKIEGERDTLVTRVVQYQNGQPKISIVKTFLKDKEERTTTKIGRLDFDSAQLLVQHITEAINWIEQNFDEKNNPKRVKNDKHPSTKNKE